jgi:hypothetical protein
MRMSTSIPEIKHPHLPLKRGVPPATLEALKEAVAEQHAHGLPCKETRAQAA